MSSYSIKGSFSFEQKFAPSFAPTNQAFLPQGCYIGNQFKSSSGDKTLDWYMFKTSADDKLHLAQVMGFSPENIIGK